MIMMIEIAIINSYVEWKLLAARDNVDRVMHYEFRMQLVERLLHQGVVERNTEGRVATRGDQQAAYVALHALPLTGGKRKRANHKASLPLTRFDASHPHLPVVCVDDVQTDEFPDWEAESALAGCPGKSAPIGRRYRSCDYCVYRRAKRAREAGVKMSQVTAHKTCPAYVCANPRCRARLCINTQRNCFLAYHVEPEPA